MSTGRFAPAKRSRPRMGCGIHFATILAVLGCSDQTTRISGEIGQVTTSNSSDSGIRTGWMPGQAPTVAKGLRPTKFATGLDHPRELYVLPNGDVLVAEGDQERTASRSTGMLAWIGRKWNGDPHGARSSTHRIILLRDADRDGIADVRTVFLDGLGPNGGMTLAGGDLYVAAGSQVLRYEYLSGATAISGRPDRLSSPSGTSDDKNRFRSLLSNRDGSKLFATTSPSLSGTDELVGKADRGKIVEIDRSTGRIEDLATELRSPTGLAWGPAGDVLWTTVEERMDYDDEARFPNSLKALADGRGRRCVYCRFAPPDERSSAPTTRLRLRKPDRRRLERDGPATTILVASNGTRPTDQFAAGMFIDRHRPNAESDVVFVPFMDGTPSADPIVVVTGFVDTTGSIHGRPSGLAIDVRGALLVADDLGGVIWRVSDTAPDDRLPEIPGKSLRSRKHDQGDSN